MDAIQILEKAKDVLRRRGWNQGGYVALGGAVCAIGAINEAANGHPEAQIMRDSDAEIAFDLLAEAVGTEEVGETWNDAPGRTMRQVLKAFDTAIAIGNGEI